MALTSTTKLALAASATALCAVLATPASAGRCGYQYPVDAPTTLSKVARACNVSLAALREANPGVDPGNVRPGQHLALPDEGTILEARSFTTDDQNTSSGASHNDDSSYDYVRDDEGLAREPFYQVNTRARDARRIQAKAESDSAPIWLGSDRTSGHGRETERMSFQQLSALRIRTASLPQAPRFVGLSPTTQENDNVLAARFTSVPSTITVKSTHPALANPTAKIAMSEAYSLQGKVIAVSGDCMTLETDLKRTWTLSAPKQSNDLLGKTITAWGEPSFGGSATCGSGLIFDVSHAVYAEPWIPGE